MPSTFSTHTDAGGASPRFTTTRPHPSQQAQQSAGERRRQPVACPPRHVVCARRVPQAGGVASGGWLRRRVNAAPPASALVVGTRVWCRDGPRRWPSLRRDQPWHRLQARSRQPRRRPLLTHGAASLIDPREFFSSCCSTPDLRTQATSVDPARYSRQAAEISGTAEVAAAKMSFPAATYRVERHAARSALFTAADQGRPTQDTWLARRRFGERKDHSRVRRPTMGSRRNRFVNRRSTDETGRSLSEKCRSCGGTRLVSALQHRDASLKRVKRRGGCHASHLSAVSLLLGMCSLPLAGCSVSVCSGARGRRASCNAGNGCREPGPASRGRGSACNARRLG